MSEWNYTKCAKPFESASEARDFMAQKNLAGYILRREIGFTAVCPTYPDGYYPDAVKVEEIENSKSELQLAKTSQATCC